MNRSFDDEPQTNILLGQFFEKKLCLCRSWIEFLDTNIMKIRTVQAEKINLSSEILKIKKTAKPHEQAI